MQTSLALGACTAVLLGCGSGADAPNGASDSTSGASASTASTSSTGAGGAQSTGTTGGSGGEPFNPSAAGSGGSATSACAPGDYFVDIDIDGATQHFSKGCDTHAVPSGQLVHGSLVDIPGAGFGMSACGDVPLRVDATGAFNFFPGSTSTAQIFYTRPDGTKLVGYGDAKISITAIGDVGQPITGLFHTDAQPQQGAGGAGASTTIAGAFTICRLYDLKIE